MFKRFFYVFLFFILFNPNFVFSQEAERETIRKLLVLMDAVNELQDAIRSELKIMSFRSPKLAKETKKLLDKADENFYMEKLIDVFSEHLTNAEAEELIHFLNSRVGMKLKKYANEPNRIDYMKYFTLEERIALEKQSKNIGLHVFKRISDPIFVRKVNDYLLKSINEIPGDKAPYYVYLGIKAATGMNDDAKSAKYFALFLNHLKKIEQIKVTNSISYKIAETRTLNNDYEKFYSNNIDYLITVLILKDDGTDINIEVRTIDIFENRLSYGKRYRAETKDLPEIAKRFSNDMKNLLGR